MSSVVFLVCFVWVFFCLTDLLLVYFGFYFWVGLFFFKEGMELGGWRDGEDLEKIRETKTSAMLYEKRFLIIFWF